MLRSASGKGEGKGQPETEPETEIEGWTLNVSLGGARVVVEGGLVVGQSWEYWVDEAETSRPIRVVWVHEESGGQIAGVQFLDCEGTIPPFEGHSAGQ